MVHWVHIKVPQSPLISRMSASSYVFLLDETLNHSWVLLPPTSQQIMPLMRVSAGNLELDRADNLCEEHMLASSHFSNGLSSCGNITYYSLHNTSGGKSQSMSHKWSSICNWLFINMLMPISTDTQHCFHLLDAAN